jgi:hypothetical protein
MQSKYKINLLRGNLVAGALMLALLAITAGSLPDRMLLWLATAWLGTTAVLLEFSHRRPPLVPWQLLPGPLLLALLWTAPERHLMWLWVWAVLLMLPQPGWMLGLTALLAVGSWGALIEYSRLEEAMLSGLVLAGLMLMGASRALELRSLRGQGRHRMRLVPGLRFWSRDQLERDLARERLRVQREGIHGELLLLRLPSRRLWSLARRLCRLTRSFENCYRLDRRTLALLLLDRDADQARLRRARLLETLELPFRLRATALPCTTSLTEELRQLGRQESAVTVTEDEAHD